MNLDPDLAAEAFRLALWLHCNELGSQRNGQGLREVLRGRSYVRIDD